jgi:zinc protease
MIPDIQGSRLPNGIRLLLVQRTALPLVHCSFVFRSGAYADPAGKAGLATLAADALDAGTATRSLASIAEEFDFAGAYYQSSVTHDGSVFTVSTLSSQRDEMTALVADLLRHASYPPAEVDRLRQQRLTSFLQQKDRPGRIASSVFFRKVFGDTHPYGTESEGDEHSLSLIARDDVVAFNAMHYTPDQLLVIGVGNLSLRELEELVTRTLGDWGDGTTRAPIAVPAVPSPTPGVAFVDRPGAVQSEIRMGCVGIRRNSPDYHAALILNRILGGQFSSRLNANLREKRGLTYGAWSMFQAFRWEGPFVAGGAFHAEKTDEAVRELTGELEKMREGGITEEEHAFARESLAGAYALAFETSGQVALALQVRELYDMPEDAFTSYLTHLRAVTRDDVLRVARAYLDPSAMTTAIVGDAATTLASIERTVRMPVTLVSPEGEPLTPPSS